MLMSLRRERTWVAGEGPSEETEGAITAGGAGVEFLEDLDAPSAKGKGIAGTWGVSESEIRMEGSTNLKMGLEMCE